MRNKKSIFTVYADPFYLDWLTNQLKKEKKNKPNTNYQFECNKKKHSKKIERIL